MMQPPVGWPGNPFHGPPENPPGRWHFPGNNPPILYPPLSPPGIPMFKPSFPVSNPEWPWMTPGTDPWFGRPEPPTPYLPGLIPWDVDYPHKPRWIPNQIPPQGPMGPPPPTGAPWDRFRR